MKIFVVSDTHFYHENIIKFENRPLDNVEQIIKNWNSMINDHDIVIHLGDVIFGHGKDVELPKLMARLNGRKILTRGNHDSYPESKWGSWDWFMERGFDFVCDYFIYGDIAFSHAPLTPLPFQSPNNYKEPVRLNIHGHLHRGNVRGNEGQEDRFFDVNYFLENKDKYKLVQIEDELRPFTLEELTL